MRLCSGVFLAAVLVLPLHAQQTQTFTLKDLQFVPGDKGWQAVVDIEVFDGNGRNPALKRFTTTATAPNAASDGDLIHHATVTVGAGKPRTIVVAVRDQMSDAFGVWQKTVGF